MKSSENQTQSPDTAAAARPASPARRRLLRGGLIGAPALLVLKSTPVMASNCALPSGFSVSGNASHNQGLACASPGSSPSYWSGQYDGSGIYIGSSVATTDLFSKYFLLGTYTDKTISACLAVPDQTDAQAMIVACYLQGAIEGGSHFPMASTVKDIWNLGVIGNNYPVPGSAAIWTKDQCLKYLKYLTGQAVV